MEHLSEKQINELYSGEASDVSLGEALVHIENCTVCRSKTPHFSKTALREMIRREPLFKETSEIEKDHSKPVAVLSNWPPRLWQIGFGGAFGLILILLAWWFMGQEKGPQIVKNPTPTPTIEAINGSNTALPDKMPDKLAQNTAAPDGAKNTSEPKIEPKKQPVQTETQPPERRELALNLENYPASLNGLESPNVVIRSGGDQQKRFFVKYPIGEVIRESQPVLQWNAVSGAVSYKVSVFDENYTEIFSKELSGTSLRVETALRRGARYQWQVKAFSGNDEKPLTVSAPAQFRIADDKTLDRSDALDEWQKAASFYKAGMLGEAERTIKELLRKNPQDKRADRFLRKIRRLRQQIQKPPTDTKPAQ